jgi:hypothetical protein
VITNASAGLPNVKALVYIAAYAPVPGLVSPTMTGRKTPENAAHQKYGEVLPMESELGRS